ncbi:hypothetical protein Q7P36_000438 [Cladosporium allicinum]
MASSTSLQRATAHTSNRPRNVRRDKVRTHPSPKPPDTTNRPRTNNLPTPTSLNLTLRFLPSTPDSPESTCAYSNTTNALTFTTSTTPKQYHCFNIAELFTGNATSGFVNQSRPSEWYDSGLYWSISNAETFDAQANYSRILYRQAEKDQEPGSYAVKRVNLYGGLDCTERDPHDEKGLLDWYGLSCWSGVEGDCGSLPHAVASFAVLPVGSTEGTCLVYAQLGAGVGGVQPLKAVASVLVGVFVAGWLAL